MAKCLICAGTSTTAILQKLEYNVGGIELEGCEFTKDLKVAIGKAGRLEKIIIFEAGIINNEIPDIVYSGNFSVLIVGKTESLLEKLSIECVEYKFVQLLYKTDKITFPFIRELVKTTQVDPAYLYKAKDITEQDLILDENNENDDTPTVVTHREVIKETPEEESPIIIERSKEVEKVETGAKREVILETDSRPIITPKIINNGGIFGNKLEEQIKKCINVYRSGYTIVFTGCRKSYTSTTAYRAAKYIAKIGYETLLLDLDTTDYTIGLLNNKIYGQVKVENTNMLETGLATGKSITPAILYENNLKVMTSNIFQYSINKEKNTGEYEKNLEALIEDAQKSYRVVIIDVPMDDFLKYSTLVSEASLIVYNIPFTNKDFIYFMRRLFSSNKEIKERLFTNSYVIAIDNMKKNLLGTNSKDLNAIDLYLEENDLVDQYKFGEIPVIGTIMTDKKVYKDYLEAEFKENTKEIEHLLYNLITGGK